MAVHVRCPHCTTKCVVAADLIGVPVLCGKCQRSFAVRSPLAARPPIAASASPPLHFEIAGVTSTGCVRAHNEDSFAAHHLTWSHKGQRHEAALLVVADGLGGHDAGEEASAMVVRAASAALLPQLVPALGDGKKSSPLASLADAIEQMLLQVNREIHTRARQERHAKGMGATAAVVILWQGTALIGHVGDTRVSHVRSHRVTQVTRDQTVAARMVELGRLSPREALHHPARHEVYQAIGHHSEVKPARYEVSLSVGDWLIAASDGLHAHVDAAALQQPLATAGLSPSDLAARLVEAANAGGGSDNCTVVAVKCCACT